MFLNGFESFFFFSSRRRHTRYWRDWSSDVCSSDLNRDSFLHGRAADSEFAKRRVEAVEIALQPLFLGAEPRDEDLPLRRPAKPRAGVGRASCRERGEISGVAVSLKKKNMYYQQRRQ